MRAFIKRNFLLITTVIFIALRVPSLIEPYWYGDEGIYAAIANEMRHGEILYTQTWDHKPPGIYLIYLFADFFGSGQLFVVRLINMLLGIATIITVFFLTKLLFNNKGRDLKPYIASALTALILGTTLLEGNIFNAENIFILPVGIAFLMYLYWRKRSGGNLTSLRYFLIGLVLGSALFIKIHPLFDATALVVVIFIDWYQSGFAKFELKKIPEVLKAFAAQLLPKLLGMIAGMLAPISLAALYYMAIGRFQDFYYAVVTYNFSYSEAIVPEGVGFLFFDDTFGLRFLFVAILTSAIILLALNKRISRNVSFIFIWVLLTFFAVRLSSRPYPHYLLQMTIPLSILLSLAVEKLLMLQAKITNTNEFNSRVMKASWVLLFVYFLLTLYSQGNIISWGYLPIEYTPNSYGKLLGVTSDEKWHSMFNSNGLWTNRTVEWLQPYSGEKVFIWGNSPWVYELADLNNPTKYVVYFHVGEQNISEVLADLEREDTNTIVVQNDVWVMSEFEAYVQENFVPIDEYNGFTLYTRKNANFATAS